MKEHQAKCNFADRYVPKCNLGTRGNVEENQETRRICWDR